MTTKPTESNAEMIAEGIVVYLFEEYPDNNQVRRDAIAEVAKRITAAQSQLAEKVLAEVKAVDAYEDGKRYGKAVKADADKRLRDLFSQLGIEVGGG